MPETPSQVWEKEAKFYQAALGVLTGEEVTIDGKFGGGVQAVLNDWAREKNLPYTLKPLAKGEIAEGDAYENGKRKHYDISGAKKTIFRDFVEHLKENGQFVSFDALDPKKRQALELAMDAAGIPANKMETTYEGWVGQGVDIASQLQTRIDKRTQAAKAAEEVAPFTRAQIEEFARSGQSQGSVMSATGAGDGPSEAASKKFTPIAAEKIKVLKDTYYARDGSKTYGQNPNLKTAKQIIQQFQTIEGIDPPDGTLDVKTMEKINERLREEKPGPRSAIEGIPPDVRNAALASVSASQLATALISEKDIGTFAPLNGTANTPGRGITEVG